MAELVGKEVKAVMPTYISFLMGRLIEIWQAWDEGELVTALRKACRLVTFLPTDLKKKLMDKVKIIKAEMRKANQVEGSDYYIGLIVKNKKNMQTAYKYLDPFVDDLVTLLDQRGYLEKVKEFRIGRFRQRA